jgi:hypothetical protein
MNVFQYFSCVRRLPVAIDAVVDHLRDQGRVHEVYFSPVDMDPSVLWSICRAYYPKTPYDRDMPPIIEVMYSNQLNESQVRLACCKELLHALDTEEERASTLEDVSTLIDQLSIPPQAGFSLPTANDHLGVVKALAVLVPRDALEDLRDAYQRGEISEGEIASAVKVPVEFVRLTLLPVWVKICKEIAE